MEALDRDLARRLAGVAEEKAASVMSNIGNLANWLNDAGLIVGQHDGNEGLALAALQLRLKRYQVEQPLRVDGKPFRVGGFQHRRMFNRRGQ